MRDQVAGQPALPDRPLRVMACCARKMLHSNQLENTFLNAHFLAWLL